MLKKLSKKVRYSLIGFRLLYAISATTAHIFTTTGSVIKISKRDNVVH